MDAISLALLLIISLVGVATLILAAVVTINYDREHEEDE